MRYTMLPLHYPPGPSSMVMRRHSAPPQGLHPYSHSPEQLQIRPQKTGSVCCLQMSSAPLFSNAQHSTVTFPTPWILHPYSNSQDQFQPTKSAVCAACTALVNRSGVAGAVSQTPLSFINCLTDCCFSSKSSLNLYSQTV